MKRRATAMRDPGMMAKQGVKNNKYPEILSKFLSPFLRERGQERGLLDKIWIPAFAGTTERYGDDRKKVRGNDN